MWSRSQKISGMSADSRLDSWLEELHERGGTDVLLSAGSPPLLRVDGRLRPLEGAEPLTGEEIEQIARDKLWDHDDQTVRLGREVDFSFSWRDRSRIRANAFYQRGTCSLAMRRIPMQVPTVTEIGLPDALINLLHAPSGLILVTGATGSGKSTSMAAMIDFINHERDVHIVTVEDPIEYVHDNYRATVSQREVGMDTASFPAALRSVLREDPDVILVGEMRDPESIAAALTIAETGHLVVTTLHTNDSAQALDRIIDVFPAERRPQVQLQLSGTLLAVLYQRLLPRVGGGLVAAHEVMVGIPAVRNLVREGKTRQLRNMVATHRADGMQTLEMDLTTLIADGVIDHDTARAASLYPQDLPRAIPQRIPVAAAVSVA